MIRTLKALKDQKIEIELRGGSHEDGSTHFIFSATTCRTTADWGLLQIKYTNVNIPLSARQVKIKPASYA
jgi:hypothetical protein